MPGDGPFYFARVDADDNEFGHEHLVEDELILRFERRQEEGGFCRLILDVVNDRVPPLSKPIWCWFSWDNGTAIEPLFFGRQVAIPSGLQGNVVTIEFIARPIDFQPQKEALAETLRVLPFYDPIFVDEAHADDPDPVLEGYTKHWHIDPVTHEVTVSDLLVGEDGLVVFDEGDAFYDSVQEEVDRAPLLACQVKATVPWGQFHSGTIPIGTVTLSSSGVEAWPKQGDSLAGGYYVASSSVVDSSAPDTPVNINFSYRNEAKKHRDGDLMSLNESLTSIAGYGGLAGTPLRDISRTVVGDPYTGTPASFERDRQALIIHPRVMQGSLTLGVDAETDRADTVSITLLSDVQPILRDPEAESDDQSEVEIIELDSNDVSEGESPPIVMPTRGEYVTTDRGLQTIEHLLMRARARLVAGARVARVSWECRLDDALQLSLRKNAKLNDPRISGGEAIGKIVALSMRGDGATGVFRGGVTIACAVGRGEAIATATGTPDYVEEGYVNEGYQTYTGQIVASGTGDVGYSPPFLTGTSGTGLHFPLTRDQVVVRAEIITEPGEIEVPIENVPLTGGGLGGFPPPYADEIQKQFAALANTKVHYELELIDLTKNAIESFWTVNTVNLSIPRQIDYETLSAS